MADPRFGGFSHAELYAMAHGGDPSAAERAHTSWARTAQTLDGVHNTLKSSISELGLGWQGKAADAARVGIGQHEEWARTAGAQSAALGESAAREAASARNVIAQMPPPAPAPTGGAAGTAGGANWAQAEQVAENGRLRAVELMNGHAAASAQAKPTGNFAQPPTAGAGGAAVGAPGTRGPAGRTPARGPRVNRGGAAPGAGRGAGTGRVGTAGTGRPAEVAGRGRGAAAARGGPAEVRAAGAGEVRGPGGRGGVGPVEDTGAPARGGGMGVPMGPNGGRRRTYRPGRPGTWAEQPEPPIGAVRGEPAASRTRYDRPPPRSTPPPLAERGGPLTPRGVTGPLGPDGSALVQAGQSTGPSGPDGGAHDPTRHGGTGDAGAGGTPMMGGGGMGAGWHDGGHGATHQRLGYLLEEDEIFTDEEGTVVPPVIGA